MKLKVQQVFEATPLLATIINEKRPLPPKGAYWIARLHTKLLPEFTTIAARHDALITAYDYTAPEATTLSVPEEKRAEFFAAWAEIADEEIEVGVDPVKLDLLDAGGVSSITAGEFVTLGELVCE